MIYAEQQMEATHRQYATVDLPDLPKLPKPITEPVDVGVFGVLRRHSPRIFAASVQTPHYRNCFPLPCITLGDDSMTTHPSFHK
jgi:hypothetical protein